MPTMDSTASAALGSGFAPAFFTYLDLDGDPLRTTTLGKDITFASTGDADLDGFTFTAFGGEFVEIGDVANSESGSDSLTVDLSGIVSIDTALMAEIGDRTKWQGRLARIWFAIYDVDGVTQQGAIVSHYTGYMSSVRVLPSPKQQTIRLTIENYLAASSDPSFRSYMNQADYDAADVSAAATLAAVNGPHEKGIGIVPHPGAFGGVFQHLFQQQTSR